MPQRPVKSRRRRRVADFAAYTLIGVAVYGGLVWLLFRSEDGATAVKWYGLMWFTVLVFGQALVMHTHSFKRLRFWLLVSGLLAGHIAMFVAILSQTDGLRGIWWGVLFLIESVAIDWTLSFLMPQDQFGA